MAEINISTEHTKNSVGTPSHEYNSMRDIWAKSRAIVRGQEATKAHDEFVNDVDEKGNTRNLLLPFSPTMDQAQYDFYKDEAELPGITSQYAKSMVGALLRKESTFEVDGQLDESTKEEVNDWIPNRFTSDNQSLFHFLDNALWEEMQTSGTWVYIDVPDIDDETYELLTEEQKEYVKPYPVLTPAEQVINVIMGEHPITRMPTMVRYVTRFFANVYKPDNPWHPVLVDTVRDHYLDEAGMLQIDEYQKESKSPAKASGGKIENQNLKPDAQGLDEHGFVLKNQFQPKKFGERLTMIPAWPLDGEYQIEEPILLTFVNREIGLYNKVSRRNHLMYGAATYTPVVISDMDEDKQNAIVQSGLGTWLFLELGATIDTLAPPTDALSDMKDAIEQTMEELARLGIRMLAPETSESGVALELRNSSQTASLGTLNMKVSKTLRTVIAFMINWRFNTEITANDVNFTMSSDFSPQAQGEMAMRLVTEWYQAGLIPRSVFIEHAKQNDFLPGDYDDEEGQEDLEKDPISQVARSFEVEVTE